MFLGVVARDSGCLAPVGVLGADGACLSYRSVSEFVEVALLRGDSVSAQNSFVCFCQHHAIDSPQMQQSNSSRLVFGAAVIVTCKLAVARPGSRDNLPTSRGIRANNRLMRARACVPSLAFRVPW